MTTSITRSTHTLSLLDGEIVEESDSGLDAARHRRQPPHPEEPVHQAGAAQPRRDAHPALARQRRRTHLLRVGHRAGVDPRRPAASSPASSSPQARCSTSTSGSLHHIENIGTDVAEFIIAFRNERPEDFGFGATFGAFTDAVLGNTYDLPASDIAKIRRITVDRQAGSAHRRPGHPGGGLFRATRTSSTSRPRPPGLNYASGNARFARDQFWPALKDISMYSLRVAEDGMREPHWHPVTARDGLRPARRRPHDGDESRWRP